MKTAIVFLAACAIAGPCVAQEPVGCDKFKWPLDKERATLTGTDLPKVASGDRVPWSIPWATSLALVPFDNAKLPAPPERAPKSHRYIRWLPPRGGAAVRHLQDHRVGRGVD